MEDRIFLLSKEEAEKLPLEIRNIPQWWYLRSPGGAFNYVSYVANNCGVINEFGVKIGINRGAFIRPAIRFNEIKEIDELPQTKKGYIIYLNKKWIDISRYVGFPCILKKKPFKKSRRFDKGLNDYEKSEIRQWLLNWLEEKEY